jgi:Xaa-Pro dipeptidase
MDLSAIQSALKAADVDGWLFYDFHNRDAIALKILNIDTSRFTSRRWLYFIPAVGEPQRIVHAIEPWKLDHLPGAKLQYSSWVKLHELIKQALAKSKKIMMQYSPLNAIPYVSIVDGGTIDLIRSFGVEVVSSADLVSRFESHLSMEDWNSHIEAGGIMQMVKDETFKEISRQIKLGLNPKEVEIQDYMHELMHKHGMHWDDGPIVAVNEHAADPHFEPTKKNSFKMKEGDLVLLDLWARKKKSGSIYYDITWMGYIGTTVPKKIEDLFQIIRRGRDTALKLVKDSFAKGKKLYGWEVDDACRKVIIDAGYGEYFTHRTGHNIGIEVHGNGVNIDNLETKDQRRIIPGTCFSVEPGIYLVDEKLGFRTEIDVFVTDEGKVEVIGAIQEKVIPILNL